MDDKERDERTAALAHQIWEAEGRPDGQQLRHWHMAQRLVQADMTVMKGVRDNEPDPAASPADVTAEAGDGHA